MRIDHAALAVLNLLECAAPNRSQAESVTDLLVDIWFHFSDTDDPTLRKIADRARSFIPSTERT